MRYLIEILLSLYIHCLMMVVGRSGSFGCSSMSLYGVAGTNGEDNVGVYWPVFSSHFFDEWVVCVHFVFWVTMSMNLVTAICEFDELYN